MPSPLTQLEREVISLFVQVASVLNLPRSVGEVYGLLGVSTASEAGTSDVKELAHFIAERRVPAIFVETSVPPRYVQALKEAVEAQGFAVEIGGTLFSDSLGDQGTPAGTYVGTVRANVETIATSLAMPLGAD